MSEAHEIELAPEYAATVLADTYGWQYPDGMPFEDWGRVGRIFRGVDLAIRWNRGDHYNAGVDIWGETAADSEYEGVDIADSTLMNYSRTCRAYPRDVRGQFDPAIVSWTHYQRASSLPTLADRLEALRRAEEGGWSTRELERYVDQRKKGAQPDEIDPTVEDDEPEDDGPIDVEPSGIVKIISFRVAPGDEAKASEIEKALRIHLQELADEMGVTFLP